MYKIWQNKITKKKRKIFLVVILVISAIFFINYLRRVNLYKSQVHNMQFSKIDIASIPDGNYVGSCDVDFVAAEVKVTVFNGSIVSIELLKHKNGKGGPAEQIIAHILDGQTTDVDTISGATNSSRVIRKAVENALLGK